VASNEFRVMRLLLHDPVEMKAWPLARANRPGPGRNLIGF
jgi:hypothetical protein